MKSVAARNPKLVHGGDRLKEIAERLKRKGEEQREKGKRERGEEGKRGKGVISSPLPFPLFPYFPVLKRAAAFSDSHRSERPSDEPNRFRF